MRATVENFRAVGGSLALPLDGICLLAGRNEAGKTSTAQAVAAAVTGITLPDGRAKREAKGLLHDGAEQAMVTVEDGESSVRVVWPDGKAYSEGPALNASKFAAGLASLPDLTAREQSRVMMDYLEAVPSYDDLAVALGPQEDRDGVVVEDGLPAETIDQVWQAIQSRDWDDAARIYRDHAQSLKGRWQEVTGEGKWGTKKGRDWRPDLWDRSVAQSSEESLQQAAEDARQREVHAQAAASIEDTRLQELRAQVDALPDLRQQLQDKGEEGRQAGDRLKAAQQELQKLPPESDDSVPCPHCGEALAVSGGHVSASVALSEEEKAQRADAIAEARKRIEQASSEYEQARDEYRDLQRQVKEAEQAETTLQHHTDSATSESGADPEEARKSREHADAVLQAYQAHHRAQAIHAEILQSERIARVLEPDGIRGAKLANAVTRFNERLQYLARVAGWKTVAIGENLALRSDGWNYRDLSASAAYRARIILQIAMAQIDQSALVIIDGADILQRSARNGLMQLLHQSWAKPALVTMTVDTARPKDDPVPDLKAAGIGETITLGEVAA